DWKSLGIPQRIEAGQRVNVAPLLRVFEDKLRYSIFRATGAFNPARFKRDEDLYSGTGSATARVNSFFTSTPTGSADCTQAMRLVFAKGLIDMLKENEFDDLGFSVLRMPTIVKDGTPGQMLLADAGFIRNFSDYLERVPGGSWQGENIVKVGPGKYWGYGSPTGRVKSIEQWEKELRNVYNLEAGTSRTARIPGFTGKILFLDTAQIGMNIFDL